MSQKDFNDMLGDYLDTRVKPVKRRKPMRSKPGEGSFIGSAFSRIRGYVGKEKKVAVKGDVVDEKEFHIEEELIDRESRPTFWERMKGMFGMDRSRPEQFVDDTGELGFKEEAEEIVEKEEELMKEEEELEERKENFIRRFLRSMGFGRKEEVSENGFERDEKVDEDLKDIAKIATKAMKLMDRKHFETFRETEDFKRFKEILERRNLIKKE